MTPINLGDGTASELPFVGTNPIPFIRKVESGPHEVLLEEVARRGDNDELEVIEKDGTSIWRRAGCLSICFGSGAPDFFKKAIPLMATPDYMKIDGEHVLVNVG